MVGWNHRLSGHELGQTLGVGERWGSLVCCSPWDLEESDATWWLNNNILRNVKGKKKVKHGLKFFLR